MEVSKEQQSLRGAACDHDKFPEVMSAASLLYPKGHSSSFEQL